MVQMECDSWTEGNRLADKGSSRMYGQGGEIFVAIYRSHRISRVVYLGVERFANNCSQKKNILITEIERYTAGHAVSLADCQVLGGQLGVLG